MPSQEPIDVRQALELRLGEVASLLADVAEALTYYPGALMVLEDNDVSTVTRDGLPIRAEEWPSLHEITSLIDAWRALTEKADVQAARHYSRPA